MTDLKLDWNMENIPPAAEPMTPQKALETLMQAVEDSYFPFLDPHKPPEPDHLAAVHVLRLAIED